MLPVLIKAKIKKGKFFRIMTDDGSIKIESFVKKKDPSHVTDLSFHIIL